MKLLRPSLLLLGWLLALGVIIFCLDALGNGALALPSSTSWRSWLTRDDFVTTAFALLRVAALVAAWYLVAATCLSLVAQVLQFPKLLRTADALSIPLVRSLTQRIVGASLISALALPGVAMATPAADVGVDTPPVLHQATPTQQPENSSTPASSTNANPSPASLVPPVAPHRSPSSPNIELSVPTPTIPSEADDVLQDRTPPPSTTPPVSTPPFAAPIPNQAPVLDESGESPPASTTTTTSGTPSEVRILRSGDNFWTVAHDVLQGSLGRIPNDTELLPYWNRLVEANKTVLADPNNPDLVFVGQQIVVPVP